jgi:hypothetical protein
MIPINADSEGFSRCIKANYYKMGCTNFIRSSGGAKDGFSATGVIEIIYEEDGFTHEPDAGREL